MIQHPVVIDTNNPQPNYCDMLTVTTPSGNQFTVRLYHHTNMENTDGRPFTSMGYPEGEYHDMIERVVFATWTGHAPDALLPVSIKLVDGTEIVKFQDA